MNKFIYFGERLEGYKIPVLNEREIRAAAGILFLLMFISVMLALLKAEFLMLKFSVSIFFADILIRVLINPKYSPSLISGRFIVRNQNPEYVGAIQKKFAWILGIILSGTAFVLIVLLNTYSPVSGIICMICLVFLFSEASFGICLGCFTYKWIYREKAQYCPGEVCEKNSVTEIQRISLSQYLFLAGFTVLVIFYVLYFYGIFKVNPQSLF